jgi:hypothetical protein
VTSHIPVLPIQIKYQKIQGEEIPFTLSRKGKMRRTTLYVCDDWMKPTLHWKK